MHLNFTTHIEQWKPVVAYESRYIVSDLGHVQRIHPRNGRLTMIPSYIGAGYGRIELADGRGGARKIFVHRMVAEAFLGPIPDGMQVNHKNGDKKDCRLENLEIVTGSYNQWHASHILGKRAHVRGSIHGKSKLTEEQAVEIRKLATTGTPIPAIAGTFSVHPRTVLDVVKRVSWTHV